jgi:hypothetical protein
MEDSNNSYFVLSDGSFPRSDANLAARGQLMKLGCLLLVLTGSAAAVLAQNDFPRNAASCEQCHFAPARLGSSRLTVERIGTVANGKFFPDPEGGVHHRNGELKKGTESQVAGERVSISLLGDGYLEAINPADVYRNAKTQHRADSAIRGAVVSAPVLESGSGKATHQFGRFGWKGSLKRIQESPQLLHPPL